MKKLSPYFINLKKTQSLFVIIMIIALFLFFSRAIISNGNMFRDVFQHYDLVDSGMDFFNSVVCTSYGEPYTIFKTLYPPLANLFFYICYLCIPENISASWQVGFDNFNSLRNGVFDLRSWQHSLVIFLVYLQMSTLLFFLVVDKMLIIKNKLFSFLILFTFGLLFALERGNIIVVACICTMFFIHYKNVENQPILRELALLSLGVAVGLKVYPAVFSILLIRDKKIIEFFKVCLYSLMLFFLPFFAFNGIEDIYTWIETAKYIGTRNDMAIGTVYFGLNQVVKTVLTNKAMSPLIMEYINLGMILSFTRWLSLIFILIMSLCAIITKKGWKALLCLSLIIILSQQHSPVYNTIFIIPAFIEYINDNEELNITNIVYFACFCLILVPLPAFGYYKTLFVIRFIALICLSISMLSSLSGDLYVLKGYILDVSKKV